MKRISALIKETPESYPGHRVKERQPHVCDLRPGALKV